MSEPCGWEITKCGCGVCWDSYTPEQRETAATLAIGIMWAATARQYGQCPVVVQPCPRPAPPRDYQTYPVSVPDLGGAYIQSGVWRNTARDSLESCSCSACEVDLEGPTSTSAITEVRVGGVLDPSAYLVQNGSILVRVDGECWPTCVNYSGQATPFQVEYLRGIPIPARVQAATERLACELAKSCVGGQCALPRRMQSLTRQGVEVTVEALSTKPGEVRTGVPEVDMVISLENPYGRAQRSIVLSPDLLPPRTAT